MSSEAARPLDPPAWLIELPLAHRGLHGNEVAENSLPAFLAAAEAGYGVELDVHASADGVPIVVHDQSLERMTGLDETVANLTAEQLTRLPLNGSGHRMPTLAQALRVLRQVPVMVELKSTRVRPGALEPAVAALIETHPGPITVASFNPVCLRWFRNHSGDVPRVMTAMSPSGAAPEAMLLRRLAELREADSIDPVAISFHLESLPHPSVDRWRERGGAIVTWTVKDEAGLALARRYADNYIFEGIRPALHR